MASADPTWILTILRLLLLSLGFDEKYNRDYNIFNPINQYRPDNL